MFRWRNQARGEGGWLVCGRPLVQAWKVHRRRAATKPRVAFIKMLNPDLPPLLSFRLLALTYVSHPPPQRGEINLTPLPLL